MKMKTKILLYSILLCLCGIGCTTNNTNTNDENTVYYEGVSQKEDIQPIERDAAYYKSKGYQVFTDYQFAVKSPVTLEDISMRSNDNFDFNYAGISSDDSYYQIMIIKLPIGYKNYQEDDIKAMLRERFGQQGGGENVLFGDENLPAYLSNYVHNGYKGKGIAVYRNGLIYAFNVMTKGSLDTKFNSFTNNVCFLNELDKPQNQISNNTESTININENPSETTNMEFHESSKYNYSIKYPKDWIFVEDYNRLVVFIAAVENSSKNFNITIINGVKKSLKDLVEGNKKEMKNTFPDVKVLEECSLLVNGKECIKVDTQCTNLEENYQQYNSMYSFVHGGKMYIINFGCDIKEMDSYKKTIRKIISSFKIVNYN